MSLTTTFLIRGVGFDAGEVGVVNKTLGLLATIVGALYGGILMQRLSLFRALLIFGILQGASNAGYWLLSITDKHLYSRLFRKPLWRDGHISLCRAVNDAV